MTTTTTVTTPDRRLAEGPPDDVIALLRDVIAEARARAERRVARYVDARLHMVVAGSSQPA